MKEIVDELVIKGFLPLAFYNLEIRSGIKKSLAECEHTIFKPYMQNTITISDSSCLISKIYHVY